MIISEEKPRPESEQAQSSGRLYVGAASLAVSVVFTVMASQLDRGSLNQPGPGVAPLLFGAISIIGSLSVVVDELRLHRTRLMVPKPDLRLLAYMGCLTLTAVALPIVGYVVTTAVLAFAVMVVVGGLSWWKAVLYGVAISIGTSFLFTAVFGVPLPTGILFVLGEW